MPFAAGDPAFLNWRGELKGGEGVRAFDPKSGEFLSLDRGPEGRRFEVMYHAVGADAGSGPV